MKYTAPALDKGLDIIEFLSTKTYAVSQKEIAEGVNKSSNEIYRMLACLTERGYIQKDPVNGCFELTLKLYSLSHQISPLERMRRIAIPIMRRLASKTNQACHITVFYENDLMIVAPTVSPGPISVVMKEGNVYPLLETTSGKTLLAQCSARERKHRLKLLPSISIDEKKELSKTLDDISQKGYLIHASEVTKGITDIAVIIGENDVPLKASLSLCCIDSQLNKHVPFDYYLEEAQKTATIISNLINSESREYG